MGGRCELVHAQRRSTTLVWSYPQLRRRRLRNPRAMMFIYQAGATGPETSRIQQRLIDLGQLAGSATGTFDDRTTAAVRKFQAAAGLRADGRVGDGTWQQLFGEAHAPCPGLVGVDLLHRCLAITGVFETSMPPPDCYSGVTGNFDGMSISFGVLQQNIGSKSLQLLLRRVIQEQPELIGRIFGPTDGDAMIEIMHLDERTDAGFERQEAWARSLNDANNRILATALSEPGRHARVYRHSARCRPERVRSSPRCVSRVWAVVGTRGRRALRYHDPKWWYPSRLRARDQQSDYRSAGDAGRRPARGRRARSHRRRTGKILQAPISRRRPQPQAELGTRRGHSARQLFRPRRSVRNRARDGSGARRQLGSRRRLADNPGRPDNGPLGPSSTKDRLSESWSQL